MGLSRSDQRALLRSASGRLDRPACAIVGGVSAVSWPIAVDPGAVIVSLRVFGNPVAAPRPRVGRRGHVYMPNESAEYKRRVAADIRYAMMGRVVDSGGTFGVQARFYRDNRHRIDVDNMTKNVLDACTLARIWSDDSQVREIASRLWLNDQEPRVEFVVYRIVDPSPRPMRICPRCGELAIPLASTRKYCSMQCFNAETRVARACARCGVAYEIARSVARREIGRGGRPGRNRFCSRSCAIAAWQELPRGRRKSSRWCCQRCGGRVSRKEYRSCRGCSMATRSDPTGNYWRLRHGPNGEPTAIRRPRGAAGDARQAVLV